jgi:hypothetical protein
MDSKQWLLENLDVLFAVMAGGMLLLLLLFLISSIRLRKVRKQYQALMKGMQQGNLEEVLFQYGEQVRELERQVQEVRATHLRQEREIAKSCGPVGVLRYNAFPDAGSDLSYSIAVLNREGDGVVLTSIFGREESRTYAKPILAGASTYHLSEEEREAIRKAMDGMKGTS